MYDAKEMPMFSFSKKNNWVVGKKDEIKAMLKHRRTNILQASTQSTQKRDVCSIGLHSSATTGFLLVPVSSLAVFLG